MSILNPEHLLDQAARLIIPPPAGPPRQADVRRAISTAYYAVFHATLIAAGDEIVGRVHRGTPAYKLVYRSVDHREFRAICDDVRKPDLPRKYRPFAPGTQFGSDIRAYADAAITLQERRHTADYDPSDQFRTSHANDAIGRAKSALTHFLGASASDRRAFLMLLLFPPR